MSILVNKDTRVLVQGITGRKAASRPQRCIEYGTKVVAGVHARARRREDAFGVPVFNTVADAVAKTGATTAR